jgi:hypothetical protein
VSHSLRSYEMPIERSIVCCINKDRVAKNFKKFKLFLKTHLSVKQKKLFFLLKYETNIFGSLPPLFIFTRVSSADDFAPPRVLHPHVGCGMTRIIVSGVQANALRIQLVKFFLHQSAYILHSCHDAISHVFR